MNRIEVALQPDGTLHLRIPGKGARWRRGFRSLHDAVKEAMKEVQPPFEIDMVQIEDENK